MLSPSEQDQLKRFEKQTRQLWLLGVFNVLFVVGVWGLMALNNDAVQTFINDPGTQVGRQIHRLDFLSPKTELEKDLISKLKIFLAMPVAILKVVIINFFICSLFVMGILFMGMSSYQQKIIRLAKKLLEAK
jgi:hypothetical protein